MAKTPTEIKDEIIEHESTIPKIDGHTWKYRLGNRAYGAGMSAFSLFLYYQTKNPLCAILGTPLIVDGIGDLITGKHHYLSYRLFKAHPRDSTARLEKELGERK